MQRTVRSHADTLDRLTTAVAIFDTDQKLRFFNQAFQKLWDLEHGFLDSAPDNALLLDRLRSEGKIAEQPEWRRWKENLLAAYRSSDPQEDWWHLPDGRTIRVVANPQPKGGVTWVFENLTEKIDLESRYQTAVRVQGETLDNLAEGVAVFGPDGRVRLSNPAFSTLWGLSADARRARHAYFGDPRRLRPASWPTTHGPTSSPPSPASTTNGAIATARPSSTSGTVLRYAIIHLPNGQVMMTFVDVTDSVNVERALKDKNEALQKSDQLKNDFVQHVSYELRSPLTNIIGFTELLRCPTTGPLTAAPARICRSYRLVVVGAAHHRQRHSRPGDGRCRHHGARHWRGARRADHRQRGRAGGGPAATSTAIGMRDRGRRARRRASTATRTASARCSSTC